MVIGFKERFIKPILAKTKKHTIREDAHNRWKEGMKKQIIIKIRYPRFKR